MPYATYHLFKIFTVLFLFSTPLFSFDLRPRASSYPYITGDTFRSYCTFIIDESTVEFKNNQITILFNPKAVKQGDTIFLSLNSPKMISFFQHFFLYIHPQIEHPYILVTHNSDCSAPGICAPFLDDPKLMAWFALNSDLYYHPKLFPIPIGLIHKLAPSGCGNTEIVDKATQNFKELCLKKDKLLYMNFSVKNNPKARKPVWELFKDKSFCTVGTETSFAEYIRVMAEHKFVLSPPGAGTDCHRTWEALLLGCIPIVKKSEIDLVFQGLPVILIDHWEEITPAFLEQAWQKMLPDLLTYNREKLYAPYWFKKIESIKKAASNKPFLSERKKEKRKK